MDRSPSVSLCPLNVSNVLRKWDKDKGGWRERERKREREKERGIERECRKISGGRTP